MENYDGDKWTFLVDGNIDKIEYKQGITLTFAYTGFDKRLASVTSNLGLSLSFTYGTIGGLISYLEKITDSASQEVEYEVDIANGFRLKKYQDKANQYTEYFYDSKGRLEEYKLPNTYSVVKCPSAETRGRENFARMV